MKRTLSPAAIAALVSAAVACSKPAQSPTTPTTKADPASAPAPQIATERASASAPEAPSAAPMVTGTFFWKAHNKSGHTVYLLGTVHMGIAASQLPGYVWDAFDKSTAVAVEADIENPALVMTLLRTDGTTLEQELGPEYWSKFVALVGTEQAAAASRMKTFFASTLLQMQGLPAVPGVDSGVMARARERKLPLRYLEEATFQLKLLEKWMSVRALKAMIDHAAELGDANGKLLDTYRRGDDVGMVAVMKEADDPEKMGYTEAEAKQFEKELLELRNRSWIAPIETMAAQGPAFVAVGAMHLLGDVSVLKMLKERGWKIERITGPSPTAGATP